MNQNLIGKFIVELRRENNMTQEQLAEKMGVTDKSVSRWENGKTMPDISLLIELTEILNTSLPELLRGKKLTKEELSKQKEIIENIIEYDSNRKYEQDKTTMIRLIMGIILISLAALNNVYPFLIMVIFDKDITEFVQGFIFGIGIVFLLVSAYNLGHKTSLQERKRKFIKNLKNKQI